PADPTCICATCLLSSAFTLALPRLIANAVPNESSICVREQRITPQLPRRSSCVQEPSIHRKFSCTLVSVLYKSLKRSVSHLPWHCREWGKICKIIFPSLLLTGRIPA